MDSMSTDYEVLSDRRPVLRRLAAYMRPHVRAFAIAFVLLMLGTSADVLGPILIKTFIDDYLAPHRLLWTPVAALGAAYLALQCASGMFNYLQFVSFQRIALRIIHQLRYDVFAKVQRLGLAFFDRTPGGTLISRITNDTEAVRELYVSVLSTFLQNIVFLCGVFVSMFVLNARLAAFCLILVPVIITIMALYRHFSMPVFRRVRQQLGLLNAKLNESLQGMYIIQAFRQETRVRREFNAMNETYRRLRLKNIHLNGWLLRPLVDLVYTLTLCLVLGFFGIRSFHGNLDIGVLYAFVNYLDRFFEPVNMMMMRLNFFQQAVAAAGRVFEILDETTLAPTQQGNGNPVIERGEIEFRHVWFSYDGRTPVLRDISFTAKPGQTVAIVGHTGSGKSTIVNLLLRFYPVDRGEILIDGVPIEQYSNAELRRKIGLVLQDPFLFAGDVRKNIRLGNRDITDEEVQAAAEFVQAHTFIERLPDGYGTQLGERGATLSAGQRQLLSFARTMAIRPRILVLDEATASIDTETEDLIQEALANMRNGRTTIAIAHRLSTIQDADLILVLHRGEIVERGTHQQLLAQRGLYYRLYLLQQGLHAASDIPVDA
jgi:ATP-binding cassette subfamily B multidrug efflux pump